MTTLFNNHLLDHVRNREFCFIENAVTVEYTWFDFLKFMKSHPTEYIRWVDVSKRFEVLGINNRPSLPKFARAIANELSKVFIHNRPSAIAFGGVDNDHISFNIHKDGMDVLYLQVLGEVNWSIWEPNTDDVTDINILPENSTCIWSNTLKPGDAVWIPRGVYHYVEAKGPRVGFSYGVEGDPNPSIYV